jgi:hypothetical protein
MIKALLRELSLSGPYRRGKQTIQAMRSSARIPLKWTHVIEKESLKIKQLEHAAVETAGQLF